MDRERHLGAGVPSQHNRATYFPEQHGTTVTPRLSLPADSRSGALYAQRRFVAPGT
jgi:hypothetical protein